MSMPANPSNPETLPQNLEWLTIDEAADLINKKCQLALSPSHIYRLAFRRQLKLSIYFQSPIIFRKVIYQDKIISKKAIDDKNFLYKLCFLNPMGITYGKSKYYNAIASTKGEYIFPNNFIWDTELIGIESIVIQKALVQSLGLPEPIIGQYHYHCGLLINDDKNTYQIFERQTIKCRLQSQIDKLALTDPLIHRTAMRIAHHQSPRLKQLLNSTLLFPVYQLPDDAFFILKKEYVDKFITQYHGDQLTEKTSSRVSTPLARFLWLACKNNPAIGAELIQHPYKLLALFEVWAKADGISDNLSGDTLKKALTRGSPYT